MPSMILKTDIRKPPMIRETLAQPHKRLLIFTIFFSCHRRLSFEFECLFFENVVVSLRYPFNLIFFSGLVEHTPLRKKVSLSGGQQGGSVGQAQQQQAGWTQHQQQQHQQASFTSIVQILLSCAEIECLETEKIVKKFSSFTAWGYKEMSLLTNSALVYEPNCGGRGRVAGSQPMSTAVHRSPNKLWRSNSSFNL